MKRVFVAVDLSSQALLEIERLIKRLCKKRWPVRWESAFKIHMTLFFIGWVEEEKIEKIEDSVKKSLDGVSLFSIRMGNLGVFPDFVLPRVVWLGVKGDQSTLVHLRKQIALNLIELGFEDEKRAWIPHLTIGRVKRDVSYKAKKELGRQLQKIKIDKFQEITSINRIVVYESKLRPSGAEYRKIYEVDLS